MKKTLVTIATLALAAASSQADVLGTYTFQRVDENWQNVVVNTSSGYGLTSPNRISSYEYYMDPYYLGRLDMTSDLCDNANVPSNLIIPGFYVGYTVTGTYPIGEPGSNNYWTMSFKFTNNSGYDMLISSIDLSMIGTERLGARDQNGNLYYQALPQSGRNTGLDNDNYVGGFDGSTANIPIYVNLYIETGGSTAYSDRLTFNAATVDAPGDFYAGSWDGYHTGTYDLGNRSFTLQAGESMTLYVKPQGGVEAPKSDALSWMGLKEIVINGVGTPVVPEPATASLSLLGLAALMMRRRRA